MKDKIEALNAFCEKNITCVNCPLYELKCGKGLHFNNGMAEEEINHAYKLAFGAESEEIKMLKAQVEELKFRLDQNNDERSKIGIMFKETLKENEDLKMKVEFLSGQCEAYKYCISKKGGK